MLLSAATSPKLEVGLYSAKPTTRPCEFNGQDCKSCGDYNDRRTWSDDHQNADDDYRKAQHRHENPFRESGRAILGLARIELRAEPALPTRRRLSGWHDQFASGLELQEVSKEPLAL